MQMYTLEFLLGLLCSRRCYVSRSPYFSANYFSYGLKIQKLPSYCFTHLAYFDSIPQWERITNLWAAYDFEHFENSAFAEAFSWYSSATQDSQSIGFRSWMKCILQVASWMFQFLCLIFWVCSLVFQFESSALAFPLIDSLLSPWDVQSDCHLYSNSFSVCGQVHRLHLSRLSLACPDL